MVDIITLPYTCVDVDSEVMYYECMDVEIFKHSVIVGKNIQNLRENFWFASSVYNMPPFLSNDIFSPFPQ